jgi:hypothetical protein
MSHAYLGCAEPAAVVIAELRESSMTLLMIDKEEKQKAEHDSTYKQT